LRWRFEVEVELKFLTEEEEEVFGQKICESGDR
jgi:hypothetical protein